LQENMEFVGRDTTYMAHGPTNIELLKQILLLMK